MSFTRRHHLIVVLALAVPVAGCDSVDGNALETDYVVESVLVAGHGLPRLWLSRAVYLEESYTFKGEPEAQVMVRVAGPQAEEEIHYEEDQHRPGEYWPVSGHRVLPLHRYDLTIQPATTTGPITATTLVPNTFAIDFDQGSEVVYQADGQLDLPISRHAYPGREKSYYLFETYAREPLEENLVPSARALYDPDKGVSLRVLSRTSSPIIKMDSSDIHHQGSLTVGYPMGAINFYGDSEVFVRALDDNVYHYSRSQGLQQGGTTFAWGEIPNPLPHIKGAHGLFGSVAGVWIYFRVVEP